FAWSPRSLADLSSTSQISRSSEQQIMAPPDHPFIRFFTRAHDLFSTMHIISSLNEGQLPAPPYEAPNSLFRNHISQNSLPRVGKIRGTISRFPKGRFDKKAVEIICDIR
ncbi:MAG: hypothetical protein AABY92_10200, partial [Thermodesulfobacteriota bacterium]